MSATSCSDSAGGCPGWRSSGGGPAPGRHVGPGSRIPAIIVSPFAKKGFVDHTQYDTTSILRFITRRWHLPVLPGIIYRDASLIAHGHPPMGDLTHALDLADDHDR